MMVYFDEILAKKKKKKLKEMLLIVVMRLRQNRKSKTMKLSSVML